MFTAQRLREKNIAEYLLYMWQTEDVIRAYGCDEERIFCEYIPRFGVQGDDAEKMKGWYAGLCDMMRREGVMENGHLQVNKNVVENLDELSRRLLDSGKFPRYNAAFYRVMPHIAAVRNRGEKKELSDIETCFDILYGVVLLRMQKKELSAETDGAACDISAAIGLLAAYYKKDREEPMDI